MRVETHTLSADARATLTSYLLDPVPPAGDTQPRPAVVVLPGGGYFHLSAREAEPVALGYAAAGFHAFVLRYHVGEDVAWPAPLDDVDAALALIREHAADWQLDPQRIAVAGFSAGGHLAAASATLGKQQPNASILIYPCITAEVSATLAFPAPGLAEHVSAATPPTFLAATSDDARVPVESSLAYASALASAGLPFELHVWPRGKHGLALGQSHTAGGDPEYLNPHFAHWHELSVVWLRGIFGEYATH